MNQNIEEAIMERINRPGWVTTRGVLPDASGQSTEEDYRMVEEAMKSLAEKGLVTLWRLALENEPVELLAAARPGFELDKDLEQRGAYARAEKYVSTR
ncbi:MAG: hypothetical protein WBG50_10695 [Desulfomonilaceae bacterium]